TWKEPLFAPAGSLVPFRDWATRLVYVSHSPGEHVMSSISRRSLIGRSAAIAGGLTLGRSALAGAAPSSRYSPAVIRAQEKTELIIYHIWGTPPGGEPAEEPSPMTQVIDAFNEQSSTVVASPLTPGGYYETLQKTQ